jgi:hypothetical protein
MPFRVLRLKHAVERNHRCKAEHAGSRVIVEPLPDGSIWRGVVEVFDVIGPAKANRCYAWIEQHAKRSVCFTRLKAPPITSAQIAVRRALGRRLLAGKVPAH